MKTHTTQHTPGPWAVNPELSQVICCGDWFRLATVYSHDLPPDGNEERVCQANANARLIAAAPDLLALARDFLALMECHQTRKHISPTLIGTFDYYEKNARAAIARATSQA